MKRVTVADLEIGLGLRPILVLTASAHPRVLPCCFGLWAIAPIVLPGSCFQVARAFLQSVFRLVTLI